MKDYFANINIQPVRGLSTGSVTTHILRLDLLHPVVSGNKWFKLQYYLQEAAHTGHHTIASFGGAYSNHIVALAWAAREKKLQSIGFIRGDIHTKLTPTLEQAKNLGMKLVYVERERYRDKEILIREYAQPGTYWIMEGGYGILGARGAADILRVADTGNYTHIACAAGTGTMLAGLVKGKNEAQAVIGISVLKNHYGLEAGVQALLTGEEKQAPLTLLHDYHFGGYAKHPEVLLRFMKETWEQDRIPTDIVYTAKLLYGVKDLVNKGFFPAGSRVLVIHSGGLQGNQSLPPGTLPF
ncbi:MAG: 1-aminocyclopropane-carboxylate deaminase [Sediminibacterium sp.]|nr:1-aminocyclopropane-carboxylate deaminase [Sediminibacterium sp.]